MKYGAGSLFASDVNARFSSRCMVVSTTSGVSPAENAATGTKLIRESSTTVQLKANGGRRLIRLVGPLAVWQFNIFTYWTRLIHERLSIPNETLTACGSFGIQPLVTVVALSSDFRAFPQSSLCTLQMGA